MEKDLPNDNLEKFLQKAFEHFEENPSDALWGKIEAGLPVAGSAAGTAVITRSLFSRWALRVAAVLLLGWSVYQFVCHRAEVGRLSEELACTRMELQDLAQEMESRGPVALPEPAVPVQTLPETLVVERIVYLPAPPVQSTETPVLETPMPQSVAQNPVFPSVLPSLASLSFTAVASAQPIAIGNELPQANLVLKSSPRWRIGGKTAIGHTSFSRAELPGPDPGPGHPQPVREPAREALDYSRSFAAGVSLEYDLGRQWCLETGLQYRQFASLFSHQPALKFGEHMPHQGGPNEGPVYDFEYYVNTPSGAAYISLSAEQADPDEVISNDEDLEVRITTEERLSLLTVPILVGRQAGTGRLTGQFRGGLLANLALDHQSGVNEVAFANQKFKRVHGNGVELKPAALRTVSFDYFLSAGFAYELTPSWRVSLAPFVSGSLTSRIDALYKDPSDLTVGLTAGASYLF